MLSTRDLSSFPDIPTFRRLTRSLAVLDAILSPNWEYRYYSFNSRWAVGEMMASMRNGSGDQWFALLCPAGAALHGLTFAADDYEREVAKEDVAAIYRHERLTAAPLERLNPDVDLESLASDVDEIGYPEDDSGSAWRS